MARVRVNAVADRDTEEIFETIRQSGGVRAAAVFEARLDTLFMRLSEFPESGAPRPSLGPDIRIGVIRPYVIMYHYDVVRDVVEVLRVVHGHRNIGPKFLPL